eukprot:scaffold74357_cov75-Phaeocystis_antarctica.AAC.1
MRLDGELRQAHREVKRLEEELRGAHRKAEQAQAEGRDVRRAAEEASRDARRAVDEADEAKREVGRLRQELGQGGRRRGDTDKLHDELRELRGALRQAQQSEATARDEARYAGETLQQELAALAQEKDRALLDMRDALVESEERRRAAVRARPSSRQPAEPPLYRTPDPTRRMPAP